MVSIFSKLKGKSASPKSPKTPKTPTTPSSPVSPTAPRASSSSQESPTRDSPPGKPHKLVKQQHTPTKHTSLPPTSSGQLNPDHGSPLRRSMDNAQVGSEGVVVVDREASQEAGSGSPSGSGSNTPRFVRRSGDGPEIVSPVRSAPPPPSAAPLGVSEPSALPSSALADTTHETSSSTPPNAPTTVTQQTAYAPAQSSGLADRAMPSNTATYTSVPPGPRRTPSGRPLAPSLPSFALPPGAAPASPTMHYPPAGKNGQTQSVPQPTALDNENVIGGPSRTNVPSRPVGAIDDHLGVPSRTLDSTLISPVDRSMDRNPVRHVESLIVKPNVAQAPRRQSEEAEMGHRHSIDSRRRSPGMDVAENGREAFDTGPGNSLSIPPSSGVPTGSLSSFETFGKGDSGYQTANSDTGTETTPTAGRSREQLDDTARQINEPERSEHNRLDSQMAGLGIDETSQATMSQGSVSPESQNSVTPQTPHRQRASDSTAALLQARSDLVGKIVSDSQRRREHRGELSEEGRETFRRAGMEAYLPNANGPSRASNGDTVEVKTRWIEPVVKEHIIPREHTEYTTIIDRDIHRHHVYPKILPVSDPNPTLLETRHRIYSSQTGEWHEVVGDAAARVILGDEVFLNGPREVRMDRQPALPGLTPTKTTFDHESIRQRGQIDLGMGDGDPTEMGYGTGGRGVVEREGVDGGEMSDWRETDRGRLFGMAHEPDAAEEIGAAY